MAAADYDLLIEQGATLSQSFVWTDSSGAAINLIGYTARMQVRSSVTSATTLLELTTENGGITITGGSGTVTLTQTATQTAAYTWRQGVYDLELVSGGGVVTRLVQGSVTVSPEVTR